MNYVVNSCTIDPVAVSVDYEGQMVEATVLGLVVELVSEDGRTSQTLRYVPADLPADQAKFEPGATITVTYERAA
jgi:hypothetical protein